MREGGRRGEEEEEVGESGSVMVSAFHKGRNARNCGVYRCTVPHSMLETARGGLWTKPVTMYRTVCAIREFDHSQVPSPIQQNVCRVLFFYKCMYKSQHAKSFAILNGSKEKTLKFLFSRVVAQEKHVEAGV